jgi:hypothetical protein
MRFQIAASRTGGYDRPKAKVTCVTCKLKKCVGNCRWETVECPRQQNGEAA